MDTIEDRISDMAGESFQTPIVTVVVQVSEDPEGGGPGNVSSTRISGRLRQIGTNQRVPLENVTYDRGSKTFVGKMTSLVELGDLETVRRNMINILQDEGLNIETALIGAEIEESTL